MLNCPGEGCTFKAKSDQGLGVHVNTCKKAKAGLALIPEEVKRRRASRERQAKRRRISPLEDMEFILDISDESDMNIDLEVRAASHLEM